MIPTFRGFSNKNDLYRRGIYKKWKQSSKSFPFEWLPYGSKVPLYSVVGDLFYQNTLAETPEKVDAIEWFPDDYSIKYKPKWQLWEQCFRVSENGILSCLWTF